MTAPTATVQRSHRKAVRFFWGLLIATTTVSLVGNIAHAALAYIPRVIIQIAAAVPPIALLAAVHGIALAVRAGASGTVSVRRHCGRRHRRRRIRGELPGAAQLDASHLMRVLRRDVVNQKVSVLVSREGRRVAIDVVPSRVPGS